MLAVDLWSSTNGTPAAQPQHLVERGPLLVRAQQVPVQTRSAPARPQRLGRALLQRPGPYLGHVAGQRRERHGQVVGPAAVVMVEAVAGGYVEPWIAGLLERGQPALPAVPALGQGGQHRSSRAALGEQVVHPGLDGQPGQPAQLVVGPVHDHVDAGHHAGRGLVADLRPGLLAELEEHHVGAVTQHQHLGVVVPHHREQVQAAVEVLAHVVVLRDADGFHHDRAVLEFGEFGDGDGFDLADQFPHPDFQPSYRRSQFS